MIIHFAAESHEESFSDEDADEDEPRNVYTKKVNNTNSQNSVRPKRKYTKKSRK